MQNITISRYKPGELTAIRVHCDADGNELSRGTFEPHAGYIEGTRDDGTRWIMFLGPDGSPQYFWPYQEEDGAVIGESIILA
jgi:hypothetical protein